jgi:hypothetical protein
MVMNILEELTRKCNAPAFEEEVKTLFAGLVDHPSQEQIQQAKVALQDTYHQYRDDNRCRGTGFPHMHRCVQHIYDEAYAAIAKMKPTLQLPSPQEPARQESPRPEPVQRQMNPEDLAAEILAEIEGYAGTD